MNAKSVVSSVLSFLFGVVVGRLTQPKPFEPVAPPGVQLVQPLDAKAALAVD